MSGNPNRQRLLSCFSRSHALAPFFTGGPMALSHDTAAALAFTTYADSLKLVRTADAHTLLTLRGDTQPITALALSPDGVYLAVASRSLAIRIYNVANTLASASASNIVASVTKPTLVRTLARTHDAPITVLEIDPSSTLLASGSSDSTVKVWDLAGGFCTHIFPAHGGVVSALCWFMPGFFNQDHRTIPDDGNPPPIHLFTAAVDGRIRLWDLRASAAGGTSSSKRKPFAVLPAGAHVSVVRGISISQNGLRLVSGARDRTVALWSQSKPKTPSAPQWVLKDLISANEGVESVGFLPPSSSSSGKASGTQDLYYTAGSEGNVRIWSFAAAKVVLRASDRDPTSAAAAAAAAAASAAKKPSADQDDYESSTRAITQVQILPAAGALAVVHADQNIDLLSLGPHTGSAASPSSLHQDRSLLRPIKHLVGFNDEVIDLALLSPAAAPASSNGEAKDSGKETHLAVCTNAPSLRIYTLPSQQGASSTTLASSSVHLLHGHTDIALCLDRSPDGKWLASAGKDRTARIWMRIPIQADDSDSATDGDGSVEQVDQVWTCIGMAEGHTESVGALAFARKNVSGVGASFLCSASQDRTTKVWDVAPLQRVLATLGTSALRPEVARALFPLKLKSLLTLKIHEKDINTLDVAPNNGFLASGSQDRTAKLFKLEYRPAQGSDVKHSATNAAAAAAATKQKNGGKADVEAEIGRVLGAAAVSVYATASLTLLTTCNGHRRGIWSVRFSPVDPAFVTASSDRTMRMWSLLGAPQGSLTDSTPGANVVGGDFGRCVKTFESHSNSVLRVVFFNRGMQLLSASADGTCRVWNVRTEENLGVLDPRTKADELLGVEYGSGSGLLDEEGKEGEEQEKEFGEDIDDEDEGEDEDEGAKVWALVVGHELVSGKKAIGANKGVGLVSGGADSVIRFWEDQTAELEVAKAKKRQIEVTREQDFSNFLTLRDYRNAIVLALELDQPRRLLNLFTRVHASRPDPDSSSGSKYGKVGGPRSYLLAREGLLGNDGKDCMTSILQSAGIIDSAKSQRRNQVDTKEAVEPDEDAEAKAADAQSVTGLAAVDDVIRTLKPLFLIQLLLYVRDWNSTVRTASIAQVVLHAIVRFHPATKLMGAFESVAPKLRARAAANGRASGVRAVGDWGAVLDGLLPYTERHYARADRTLVESRTLEYTLAGMDAILGPAEWDVLIDIDDDDDKVDVEAGAAAAVVARKVGSNGKVNGRLQAVAWKEEEDDDESDGMDVDLDGASESDASEE